jgi:hypothetical protein
MSEHITHLAICDDAARLSALHPHLHPRFVELFATHRDAVHLGAITRSADKWTPQLIGWARAEFAKPAGQRAPWCAEKLAFALGALTHRAADRLMKPIIWCWHDPASGGDPVEATIHQDIFILREVYGGGVGEHAAPFNVAILQNPATPAEAKFEEYARVVFRRLLISLHTFAPDSDNMQHWLSELFERLQTFPLDLRQHARIAAEWDAVKVQRYLIAKRFYDRDDPVIQVARRMQQGVVTTPAAVVTALAGTSDASSRYARALRKALDYLLAATELFEGKIDEAAAAQRFDIGVPELALAEPSI